MIIPVHMFAFAEPGDRSHVRNVEIPDDEFIKCDNPLTLRLQILELVFKYGQNEFQSKPFPSVSVGDVAQIDDKYYLCASMGWDKISKEEFEGLELPTGMSTMFRKKENV